MPPHTWYVYSASTNSKDFAGSAGLNFSLAGLAAPMQIDPSGTTVTTTPTFMWTAVTGANHYYLYVADETAGGTAALQDAKQDAQIQESISQLVRSGN